MTARARAYAAIVNHRVPPKAEPGPRRIGRAIVLGGSVAGLMAARVLADLSDEVVIIEADGSDVDEGPRPGVPQGSQVHAILAAGQLQLEHWFPGFTAEADAAGALATVPEHIEFYINDQIRPGVSITDVPGLQASRPFLEAMIRRRTLEFSNVRIVIGRATGIRISGTKVTGALYSPHGEPGAPIRMEADLVLDATGRASRLSDWLTEAGWPAPPLTRMPIKLNYATAIFRRNAAAEKKTSLVTVYVRTPAPDRQARIGGFLAIENDRWIVLVAGYDEDRPGHDLEDFTTRCRRDFPPAFSEILDHCELISDVVTYHQADSRRRDYDQVPRIPARLFAAGDAVASFNPVYGQGMTSAMLHASCLSSYLRTTPSLDSPAKAYFEQVRVVVDAAWQTSTFPDLALPHVSGPYPPGYRIAKRVSEALLAGSVVDETLNVQLSTVTGMLAHPDALMTPATLLRTMRAARKARKSES